MCTQVLYPRVCSPSGAFPEGVKASPFRVNRPQKERTAQMLPLGKPMGVAVSRCITWYQNQQILTTCQIRYHSHLWDHRRSGTALNVDPER